MTKANKLLSMSLTAAMLSAGVIMPVNAATGDPVGAVSKDGVAFRLGMIGDSHVTVDGTRKEHFEQAVKILNDTVGGIDAYGLNGDIVYYSKGATLPVNTSNYDHINAILEANGIGRDEGEIPFVASMGNHEFPESQNKAAICEEYVTAFETKFEQGLDYHTEFNGYHIIASGGRTYNLIDLKDTDGDGVGDTLENSEPYYNTNEEWIMNEIEAIEAAADYNPNEPIFLMLHHPLQSTTGQIANPMPQRYTAAFKTFLNERPNIINLVGHSHIATQHPDSIWQDGFTTFQTPNTGTYGSTIHQTSFVDVTTDNKVKIYKIDMNSGAFIGEPWVIDIAAGKEGFQYTQVLKKNTATPTFASNAQITIDKVEDYSVTLSYPTGSCASTGALQDGIVSVHTIVIKDKETGRLVKSSDYGAGYNVVPQPEIQTKTITGLAPGTTYTVSVTPKSIMGVSGTAILTEFTTAGEKASVEVGETIELTFDENLVGGTIETTTTDDAGNEITTSRRAYEAILQNGVRISPRTLANVGGVSHPFFTYVLNVGEGEEIKEAGTYRVSHRYSLEKASAGIIMSVKHPGSEAFVPMVKQNGFKTTGNHSTWATLAKDDYITLKEGENILKVYAYAVDGNDAFDIELPILNKVISGGIADYVINKEVYNAADKTAVVTGTGSIASNVSTTSYQRYDYLTFRKNNYVVLPVTVPHTALYKMEIDIKSTKAIASSTFKAGFAETEDSIAYSYSTSFTPSSKWVTNVMTESVLLEAGKTYYCKIGATTVGDNHIVNLAKMRLTDTGAALSALSVTGGTISPTFSGGMKDYTVTVPMPSSQDLADVITATPVDSNATVTIGDATVDYGINSKIIPITVTGPDGVKQGEYRIKAIIRDSMDISDGVTAVGSALYTGPNENNLTLLENQDCTQLFTTQTNLLRFAYCFKYSQTGYIQIDLGKPYNLTELKITTGAKYDEVKGMTVTASADAEFTNPVTIATNPQNQNINVSIPLDSTNAYRFIRINKTSTNYYFIPRKIKLYALPEVTAKTAEDLQTTVSVPSAYYAIGDSVIAATYDSKGVLTGVKFGEAQNAATTEVVVTKKNSADSVKAMVWENTDGMLPRSEAVNAD